jgi:hypothetical protein
MEAIERLNRSLRTVVPRSCQRFAVDLLAVAKAQEEGATAAETPQQLDAPEEHPARRRGRRTAEE